MNPTTLNLFVIADYKPFDEDFVLSFALAKIKEIRKNCGYIFDMPMPVAIEAKKLVNKETVSKIFGGTKQVEKVSYSYDLIFNKRLTEAELNMWRMFKMGWRSARWPRY